ncbi:FtsX-like permease family protein [Paenarthrobacter sp. NPDC089989]|uniref:FtsX-like permease family protein n=1 Tax=unclassified Paenarthrobacter TaxID=2634190 RepID=UPI0037F2C29C
MNTFHRIKSLTREAWVSALNQPVISITTIVIIAAVCAAVLLTTGRTVSAEKAVLNSIDTAGTRSIIVRLDAGAGIDSSVVRHLERIAGVEWVGAFGRAEDVRNASTPAGTLVPLRKLWTSKPSYLGIDTRTTAAKHIYGSRLALTLLGSPKGSGGATDGKGSEYSVLGLLRANASLDFLEPILVSPQAGSEGQDVGLIVVVADSPGSVARVSSGVKSTLYLDDPRKVKMETSENLTKLRSVVSGQLGSYGRELVGLLFGITATLMATLLFAFVILRRRDFGRRRALGATRGLIMTLQLLQVSLVATIGVLVGTGIAVIALLLNRDTLPDWKFTVALSILSVLIAITSALLPASVAARRDPVKELRIP